MGVRFEKIGGVLSPPFLSKSTSTSGGVPSACVRRTFGVATAGGRRFLGVVVALPEGKRGVYVGLSIFWCFQPVTCQYRTPKTSYSSNNPDATNSAIMDLIWVSVNSSAGETSIFWRFGWGGGKPGAIKKE